MKYSVDSLSTSSTLSTALNIYRDNFVSFAIIVGVVWLPAQFISHAIGGIALATQSVFITVAMMLAISAPLFASFILQSSASAVAVAQACLGQRPTLASAYLGALPRLLDIFLTSVLYGLAVLVGFLCLVIPGIIMVFRYAYALPIVIVEKLPPMDAMRRSAALTEGRKGQLFLSLLIVGLVTGVVVKLSQSLLGEIAVPVLGDVLRAAPEVLLGPVAPIVIMLDYLSARTAKEGFGLEQLGTAPAGPSTT